METGLSIAIVTLALVCAWLIVRGTKKQPEPQSDALLLLQQHVNDLARSNRELSQTIDNKLNDSSKAMRDHFGQTLRLMQETAEKLGRVDEGQKQVVGLAEGLGQLQRILTNPKQRGVLGEYFLEMALKNVLAPTQYKMQHAFRDGTIVDAAIYYGDQVIPIDAKFSLENFNRLGAATTDEERKRHEDALRADLKVRIDETSKYVKAADGTCEFALMYVPSDAIFYELLTGTVGTIAGRNLVDYAAEKKVTIVSPTLFYAVLQVVLQNLREREFNKGAEEVRKRVIGLIRHLERHGAYLQKLDAQIGTVRSTFDKTYQEFEKIDKDVIKIAAIEEVVALPEASPVEEKAESLF